MVSNPNKDYLEEYERLKSNIKMFFLEVDSLITDDTEIIVQLKNLKERYLGDTIS